MCMYLRLEKLKKAYKSKTATASKLSFLLYYSTRMHMSCSEEYLIFKTTQKDWNKDKRRENTFIFTKGRSTS